MTKWHLKCEECGTIKIMDVGYNLYEMKKIFVYCYVCRKNTFHKILKHEE